MTTLDLILEVFTHFSLLVTCTFLLGVLKPRLKLLNAHLSALIQGSLLGVFALLVMLNPILASGEVIFDLPNVIIAVAGAFGGIIPAAMVSLFVIVYRLFTGGVDTPVDVASALTSIALGVGLYFYQKRRAPRMDRGMIGLGLVVAVQTLAWHLLLPDETAQSTVAAISLPLLITFPLSSWLLGFLLRYQERHIELETALSTERNMLRTLIDHVPDYIFIKDREGRFLLSNLAQAQAAHVAAPANLLGRTAEAFFPPEYLTQPDLDDQAVLQGESIIAQERPSVDALGQPIWISTTKVPLRDADGQVSGIVGISRDIMERKQAEVALEQERNMLRTLIDNVPDYIFVKDSASRYLLSNLAHAHAAGATVPADLIGKTAAAFFPADYVLRHNDDDQVVLSGASIIAQERQTVNADGTRIWVSTTKVPLRDAQGKITGMVGISRDITAHKHAEAALQQERNLLRTLIDTIPANVYIKDSQSRFVDANSETILKFGVMTASELIGKTDFDFFSPELAAKYFADEQAVLQSGQPLLNREERTVDQRTQQQRWLLTTKAPVRNESGEVMGLVGVGLDITSWKQAEEALRANEAKLQTFFEVLPVGVSVLNSDGQIIEMNPALARILDISMEGNLAGAYQSRKYISGNGTPMQRSDFPSARVQVEKQVIHNIVVGVIKEDETTVWTSVSAAPLPLANSGTITVTVDITERKQAEAQTLALVAERQRVKLLSEFITDVSHDFRTPVTIIGTSAYLVSKTTDPLKLARCSQRIQEQVSRLSLLLDSFVELAHLEQEAASALFQPTDLEALTKTLIERSQAAVEAKYQQLDYQSETLTLLVLGDASALAKAVTQVLTNAIRYTPDEGKITVHLALEDGYAVLEVADTGIGIPAEDLPHIFETFYRVDSARATESGGAGLGLSIAKKIVELMSGHIEAESEVGVGSVFRIFLPLST